MTDPCLLANLLATAKNACLNPPAHSLEKPIKWAGITETPLQNTLSLPSPEISPAEFSPLQTPVLPDLKFLEPKSPFDNLQPNRNPSLIPLSELNPDRPAPQEMAYYPSRNIRPKSGTQMFEQRMAALQAGKTYTRLAVDSFIKAWKNATEKPTYQDWKYLLKQEAKAISRGQGANQLNVLIGDSLSLWFPSERLPAGSLWLNQGISGDNTTGILQRINTLNQTNPHSIYLMAGINDLRQGETDADILWNLRQIVRRLRQNHPQTRIILQSILPTRFAAIPNSRIQKLNKQLAMIAAEEQASYLELERYFSDEQGNLRRELTTDGLHLNARGYAVWEWALQQTESWIASNEIF
ncbi:MAG TPA: SGNH/GDSL hydrolase family protein [Halomicronema sp.]